MRILLIIAMVMFSGLVHAQQDRLSGTSLDVHYYEKASHDQTSSVVAIISASFDLYIEKNYLLYEGQMIWSKSEKEIEKDLEQIVKGSIKFYNYKELSTFRGFNDAVGEQIKKMSGLSFKEDASFSAKWTEDEIRKREYVFYKKEMDYLRLLLDTEIGVFTANNLLSLSSVESFVLDSGLIDYKEDELLSPIEIALSEETLQLLEQGDESRISQNKADNDTTLFGEIRRLMLENNNRMDRLEDQVNAMRIDQLEWMDQQNKERDQMLQAQIDDLKGMVLELVRINAGEGLADSRSEAGDITERSFGNVANVPSFIDIYFDKNATKLTAESQLVLAEIVDITVRNPRLKILITGMADKSGNEAANLILSQERAKAVKNFFVKSGLAENRFIIRYTGSSKAEAASSTDRKVRMEFIQD